MYRVAQTAVSMMAAALEAHLHPPPLSGTLQTNLVSVSHMLPCSVSSGTLDN